MCVFSLSCEMTFLKEWQMSDNRSCKANFWLILALCDCPAPLAMLTCVKGTDSLATVSMKTYCVNKNCTECNAETWTSWNASWASALTLHHGTIEKMFGQDAHRMLWFIHTCDTGMWSNIVSKYHRCWNDWACFRLFHQVLDEKWVSVKHRLALVK